MQLGMKGLVSVLLAFISEARLEMKLEWQRTLKMKNYSNTSLGFG